MTKVRRTILLAVLVLLMALSFTVAACNAGDKISLLSPKDGATGVSTLPAITWTQDDNAEWYELKISEQEDFSAYVVYEAPLYGTSYQVKSALKNSTKYYLKIKACAPSYGAEIQSSFTTKAFEPDEDRNVAVDETIFSFDYKDQAELESAWTMHGGGDPVEMTLVDSPVENGGKAVKIDYFSDNSGGESRQGWTQAYAKLDDDKYVWDLREGIKFYLESDGSGMTFRLLFVERIDDYFYIDIRMNTEYKGYVTVPFEDFMLDTDNSFGGGEMTLDAVKKLAICTVGYKNGSYLIDDISIVTECENTTYLVEKGENNSLVYDDFTSYADTAALQEVWIQHAESANGNPTLETDYLGHAAMKIEKGTAIVYATKTAPLDFYNALKVTYYTLSAYNLEVASYIENRGDFNGKLELEACTDDNYKTAILRIGGGKNAAIGNLQFKSFAADTYISKVEFIEDDSAPKLNYTATKDSITIEAVAGAEYSIDGGVTWNNSNVFENLELGTYTLAIRYKATDSFAASQTATKEVSLSEITFGAPFMDDMVLQRNKSVSVWAYGNPETEYTLTFAGQSVKQVSDADGYVEFTLAPMQASTEGRTLEISGDGSVSSIENVLVGEVWIAAGQSNMQMAMATTDYTEEDIAQAQSGLIRLFIQDMTTADTPQTTFRGGDWFVANEVNAKDYSALGYLFGANLYAALGENVPVGIVYAAEGGTDIEAWISPANYSGDKATKHGDYNGMIAPMKGMTVGGVLWYQGENNAAWAMEYADLLQALVKDWRETFADDDLYFLVIQLPRYNSGNVNWAYLREAQEKACAEIENCDLIVTIDHGDLTNIHPTDKREIALRCVEMAQYKLFGGEKTEYSFYQSSSAEGNKLTVTMSSDSVLTCDGTPVGFELAGADGVYYPATAQLSENTVVLTSDQVSQPVYARYNFTSVGGGNVFNSYGLPLAPFRTDTANTLIIDDFTSYGTTEALQTYWGGSNIYNATAELTDGIQDAAMKLTSTGAGAQASLALGGSWSGYKSVRINFKVSENYGTFTFVLNLGNEKYAYRTFTGNGEWQTVQFLISSLGGDISDYNGTVAYIIIKLENGGSVIIDDITVSDSEEEIEAGPDYTDRVYEDFESYADSDALNAVWSPYLADVTLETENGSKVMKIVNNAENAQAQKTVADDWSGYKSISVTYRTSGKGVSFQLVLNPGNSYPYIQLTGNGEWQTATFLISSMEGIETYSGTVAYMMIKPIGVGNWVMIDEIKLVVDAIEDIPQVDAEDYVINDCNYADDSAIQQAVTDGKIEMHSGITLSAQDGKLKVTSAGQGWQHLIFKFNQDASLYEYLEFYVDFSNYTGGEFIIQLSDSSYATFQNMVGDSSYNYNNLKKGVYRIPLADFVNDKGVTAEKVNLVFVNFVLNDTAGGSLLLSDIKLVNADGPAVPSEDATPENPDAPDYVINDCNSATDEEVAQAVAEGKFQKHEGITLGAEDSKLKVTSAGKGWQHLWVQVNKDASDYEYLEFYVDFSNYTGGEFIIQIIGEGYVQFEHSVDGVNFNYNNLKKGVYRIPLADFVNDKGVTAEKVNLVFVNFVLNDAAGGSLLLSDIKLVNADGPAVPDGSASSEDTGTMFEDFESYADGNALTAKWAPYNATVTLETDGSKAMKVTCDADGAQASCNVNANWSEYTSVTLRFKTNADGVKFYVSLYYGDNVFPYYEVTGNGEWQTVTFNIEDMQGHSDYTGWVGMLMFKPNGNGNWVMIDEIVLS